MNGRMEGEYEGARYRLYFDAVFPDGKLEIDRTTWASVQMMMTGEWTAWWTGRARLHPKDRHCKETGRKVALASALEGCKDKAFRTFIWSLYHGRKGGAK